MAILKSPYEISIWEDRLTLVSSDGKEYDNIVPEGIQIETSYFKEIKLCVIGSNLMDAPTRVHEPELKRTVKGENILTFSIYSKYYDKDTDTFVDNPFIPFLVNERKIKLKYYKKNKIQWLDFVIKNVEESSENYKYIYTAKDLFVNELATNGFNLVFDQELENNQGTVNELGAAVLQGTDWEIGEDSELIQQLQEEALYRIVLNENIVATNIITNTEEIIFKDEVVYGFYSSIVNKEQEFFQFIYNEDGNYLTDDNRVIYNANSYFISLPKPDNEDVLWPTFAKSVDFINDYRGERLVRYQLTAFDKVLDKYVKVYVDSEDKKVYGYSESKYISEQTAQNYISNSQGFVSNSGWQQNNKTPLMIKSIPSFEDVPDFDSERVSTLEYIQSENNFLFNSGFRDNKSIIESISEGEVYGFRIKCGILSEDSLSLTVPNNTHFNFQIKSYKIDSDGTFMKDDDSTKIILEGSTDTSNVIDSNGYLFGISSANFSVSQQELNDNKYGIFITAINSDVPIDQVYYIQDVQFFRYFLDKNNNVCLPDGTALNLDSMTIEDSFLAYVQNIFYYYYPNKAETKEEIEYIYIGKESEEFKPKYTTNFEKIRSITASETNRFDLLQSLSEIFECWCRIDVKHKDTGEILLWKDISDEILIDAGSSTRVMDNSTIYSAGNSQTKEATLLQSGKPHSDYQQQKFISFHKYIGQENNIDFTYGINLKSIVRNLESEGTVSKLVVKDNNNEFAPYGSCSISRAKENPSGENFIYDFTYYISQGLLNYENVNNDLYSLEANKGWLGYYSTLKKLNDQAQLLIDEQVALFTALNNYKAEYEAIRLQYEASVETLKEKEEEFYELTQYTYDTIPENSEWLKEKSIIALSNSILKLREENKILKEKYEKSEQKVAQLEEELSSIEIKIEDIVTEKQGLVSKFEKKYYRFIQEGPWTSEDYTDDNLYYLDANSTLHNSSQPKVSYTINIVELSQIEGFENYLFELGDITHIQDTDFFGWVFKDGCKTPYKEKIVVTEEIINFDNPEKNTIKVQNYRSQFEDLFQRLTVATQKIEFRSGAYNRAANIVNPDGSISSSALQDAFSNNSSILQNANNNSVSWDEKGIITRNTLNPNEIVRITSGGIFLTNDGGATWTTGITGQGINAKIITTGQLDTSLITILNGTQSSFRWDSLGINAYYKQEDGYYNNRTFVRFDQYGLYGVKELGEAFAPTSEEEVWEKANFALTWKGFMLKNKDSYGSIIIDSEKGINLLDSNNNELIHIGYMDEYETYGIKILDDNKDVAFLAEQDGLYVGGWKVRKNEFFASTLVAEDDEGKPIEKDTYEIRLLSDDSEEKYRVFYGGNSVYRSIWRILVSDQFGVDKHGWVYANSIFSGRIWLDITAEKRVKFSEYGIILEQRASVDEEFNQIGAKSWEEIIGI